MTNNPLVEALRTLRDYVADAADGTLTYEGGGESFIAMAKEDLVRIDTALASSAPATGEREQIVAWLRSDGWVAGALYAAAIERGDHRTQSGEMEGGEHG
jgi:hypothetical protein